MAGHLFVVPGDIRRLSCDAWLLPCDGSIHVMDHWWGEVPELDAVLNRRGGLTVPARWGDDDTRVLPIEWPHRELPRPWLVNTGSSGKDAEWYVEGVEQFLDAAAKDAKGRPSRNGRARPLVALPLIGTGAGGKAFAKGEVVRGLVPALVGRARRLGIDIALVTRGPAAYAAVVEERRACLGADLARELPLRLRNTVTGLARTATAGDLVIFVGAGVSVGAGVPSWRELLERLMREPGVDFNTKERKLLEQRSQLDQAQMIELRLRANQQHLGRLVAEHVRTPTHALSHALIASMPTREFVTTNYDDLLERAAEGAGVPMRVLPARRPSGPWLLKLHGSITQPEEIVLTREDYMRYTDRRQALAGIVQAMLVTKHMLFVGFSLEDDNFHRIADDVRKVLRPSRRRSDEYFGTALVPTRDVLEDLWAEDIEIVTFGKGANPASFRQLEIALDYLLSLSVPGRAHVLASDYRFMVSKADEPLVDALHALAAVAVANNGRSGVRERVLRMLGELGYPNP